ncbi:MAG: hypothetical protein CMJ64_03845 [Planctomycetaceae bacterium]|nr:hypothetical protein [Planctomycetaceae bacterium]
MDGVCPNGAVWGEAEGDVAGGPSSDGGVDAALGPVEYGSKVGGPKVLDDEPCMTGVNGLLVTVARPAPVVGPFCGNRMR